MEARRLDEQVVRAMWATHTLAAIGSQFGVAGTTVLYFARRKLGLTRKPRGPQRNRRIDRAKVLELVRQGLLYRDVGAQCGCGVKAVSRIAREAGIERCVSSGSRPQNAIVRAYQEGEASTSIADRLGMNHSGVLRILRMRGVRIRRCKIEHDVTDESVRACLSLWNRGLHQKEIGRLLNLNVWQVRYRLHRTIPPQSKGMGAKRAASRRRTACNR